MQSSLDDLLIFRLVLIAIEILALQRYHIGPAQISFVEGLHPQYRVWKWAHRLLDLYLRLDLLYDHTLLPLDRLDLILLVFEHLDSLSDPEGDRVRRVPHIVNHHVHEHPVVFELVLHALHLLKHQLLANEVLLEVDRVRTASRQCLHFLNRLGLNLIGYHLLQPRWAGQSTKIVAIELDFVCLRPLSQLMVVSFFRFTCWVWQLMLNFADTPWRPFLLGGNSNFPFDREQRAEALIWVDHFGILLDVMGVVTLHYNFIGTIKPLRKLDSFLLGLAGSVVYLLWVLLALFNLPWPVVLFFHLLVDKLCERQLAMATFNDLGILWLRRVSLFNFVRVVILFDNRR